MPPPDGVALGGVLGLRGAAVGPLDGPSGPGGDLPRAEGGAGEGGMVFFWGQAHRAG